MAATVPLLDHRDHDAPTGRRTPRNRRTRGPGRIRRGIGIAARRYSPPTVRANNVRLERESGFAITGEFVQLSLEDTGAGMAPTVLARLRAPLYDQSKWHGHGTPPAGHPDDYRLCPGARTCAECPGPRAVKTFRYITLLETILQGISREREKRARATGKTN